MNSPRVSYVAHPNTTREGEISALAGVYKYVLEANRKKEAVGRLPSPDDCDGTKAKEDSANASIIQQ
jgi:hypothetical protein